MFEYNDDPFKRLLIDAKRMHDDNQEMKGGEDVEDLLEEEMKKMAAAMTLA